MIDDREKDPKITLIDQDMEELRLEKRESEERLESAKQNVLYWTRRIAEQDGGINALRNLKNKMDSESEE